MKGSFATALIMFFIFIIGMVILSLVFNSQQYNNRNEKMLVETEEFSLQKAMETAKIYTETSLKYSFYQSCYNISGNGGNLENNGDPTPDRETFTDNLETRTLEILDTYTKSWYSFFENYDVAFPVYSDVFIIDYGDGIINVSASSDGMFSVERELDKKDLTVKKKGNITVNITSPCFVIYGKASSVTAGNERSVDTVEHELNKWPVEFSVELDHAMKPYHNDALYEIINSQYPQLIRENTFEENTAIEDTESIITSQIEIPAGNEVKSGEFIISYDESSVTAEVTPSCTGYSYTQNSEEKSHKDCAVSYAVTVSLKTTINQEEPALFPVFNGTDVVFDPITFKLSSNTVFERPSTTS